MVCGQQDCDLSVPVLRRKMKRKVALKCPNTQVQRCVNITCTTAHLVVGGEGIGAALHQPEHTPKMAVSRSNVQCC